MGSPSNSSASATLSLSQARLPRRARSVLLGLFAMVGSQLDDMLPEILHETELTLARTPHTGDPKQDADLRDAMRSLGGGLRTFNRVFQSHVETTLAQLESLRKLADSTTSPAPSTPELTLSLLEEDEVNDDLLLENMASRISSRNSLALQLLGYRLGVLAAAPAFEADVVPLGPFQLCKALEQAADSIKLTRYARMQLFQQFERKLFEQYGSMVDSYNARLVESAILPHLSFIPVRTQPSRQADAAAEPHAGQHPAPASAPHAIDPALAAALGELVPTRDVPATPSAQPAPAEFAALQALLGQRRALLSKLKATPNDERQREELPHAEVLQALQQLASTAGNNKADRLADVRQMLMAQARQQRGHGVHLSQSDNDSFDLLQMFMSQLQSKVRKSSPGEALIERLRLPLTQLALRDPHFFTQAEHPARQLLETLSEAGDQRLASDDLDAQWLGLLQRAVSSIQQDGSGSAETFSEANQTLQSGLQAMQRRSEMAERRQVDAARGREKLAVARQRASAEIAKLLAGRTLPAFQTQLMEQTWTDVLSLAHLRGGEHSESWQTLAATTAHLLDACITGTARLDANSLRQQVLAALEQVGYHAEDAGKIARHLTQPSADADAEAQAALLQQLQARTRLGEGSVEPLPDTPQPRTPLEQDAYAQLNALHLPAWLDIQAETGEFERRKLAWTSPQTGLALLINRRGQRVSNASLDDLARKLAAGQLRIVGDNMSPASEAWQETLSSLKHLASDSTASQGGAHNGY